MRSVAVVPIGFLYCLALSAPAQALAAQEIFLVIPGIDGGSANAQFAGAFDAVSATSGVGSETGAGTGAGAGAAKPTFEPVVVNIRGGGPGSAALEQAAATGQRFPQATVTFRRAGDNPFVFLTYTLTDAGVASFKRDSNATEDRPTESVSLTYTRIKTDYQAQNADGSAGPVVTVCWDVPALKACQ
jgi:type VI secretion system secreted protein Hcp